MALHQRTFKTRLLKGMCKLATGARETILKLRICECFMFVVSYLKKFSLWITEMLISPYAKIDM